MSIPTLSKASGACSSGASSVASTRSVRSISTATSSGVLSIEVVKQERIGIGGVVSIYYDPPPIPQTAMQIERFGSYCLGGGFTTSCGPAAASILKPPRAGYHYSSLDANEVIVSSWTETSDRFLFTARMGHILSEPGVYTVVLWRDSRSNGLSEVLVELSVFVE